MKVGFGMENIIEVRQLTKRYKELTAVDRLDLDVVKGQILGLLGPNGSGKSTTINCILSLLKYDEGQVEIMGKPMHPDAYDIKAKLGVVFQDVGVFEELTVYENIDYFCGLYIQDKLQRKQYVQDAIDLVGLNDFVKFVPKKLSGGLLRRLNIACGIAHKPEIILFDEPTVAVDPQSRNHILEGIVKLNQQGSTIIYTSHYMEEVEQICDHIVIIDKGKMIAQGSSSQLKDLIDMAERVSVEIKGLNQQHLANLRTLKHNLSVKYSEPNLELTFSKGTHNVIRLIEYFQSINIEADSIFTQRPTLNDVFLELTGKDLRDN